MEKNTLVYAFPSSDNVTKTHVAHIDYVEEKITMSIEAFFQLAKEKDRASYMVDFIQSYFYRLGIEAAKKMEPVCCKGEE